MKQMPRSFDMWLLRHRQHGSNPAHRGAEQDVIMKRKPMLLLGATLVVAIIGVGVAGTGGHARLAANGTNGGRCRWSRLGPHS